MPIGAYKPVGDKAQGGCRPGAAALHQYIIGRWGAGVGSFGCYNPNSRAGNGWSLHREGRAIDVSIAQGYQHKGDDIFNWTIRNADSLGLQEIQWAGKIWTSRRSQEGIRADTSPAGKLHYDHVHIGLADGWSFTPPGDTSGPPPSQGVEDLAQVPQGEWNQMKADVEAIKSALQNNTYGTAVQPNVLETLTKTREIHSVLTNNTFGLSLQNLVVKIAQKTGVLPS